jgi:hypothetical protein
MRHLKRPIPHDIAALLDALPLGQRRVAEALIGGEEARTYPEVADLLRLHVGSVHTHLRRLRLGRPEVYAALMRERERQLAERHEEAQARAEAHSREWHRKQANRRYYHRFGEWPWEARLRRQLARLRSQSRRSLFRW